MTENGSPLKFPAGQPGESLKTILSLLSAGKPGAGLPVAAQPDQIGPELAYKLAQASTKAKDPLLLRESVVRLLEALEGINAALGATNDTA